MNSRLHAWFPFSSFTDLTILWNFMKLKFFLDAICYETRIFRDTKSTLLLCLNCRILLIYALSVSLLLIQSGTLYFFLSAPRMRCCVRYFFVFDFNFQTLLSMNSWLAWLIVRDLSCKSTARYYNALDLNSIGLVR